MKGLKEQMVKRYVVKNCPNLAESYYADGHISKNECSLDIYDKQCSNCTDCLIKQVIDKCKNIECPCEFNGADCWECNTAGQKTFAQHILQLFEIEEVE